MDKKLAWLQTNVRAKRARTPNSISLFLANPLGDHVAGQHVDVRLVAEDGYEARRSYSIASVPGSPELELLVERLPGGEVSPFLADDLQPGDVLELRGPIGGHFTWTPSNPRSLVLVAGGSGIAPLMSIVRQRALAADPDAPALLLYSARTWQQMAYAEELERTAAKDPSLSFVAITTREQAPRPGDFGRRIDSDMLTEVFAGRADLRDAACFVCGATGFVEAAATTLVRLGIPADSIKTERYGGA